MWANKDTDSDDEREAGRGYTGAEVALANIRVARVESISRNSDRSPSRRPVAYPPYLSEVQEFVFQASSTKLYLHVGTYHSQHILWNAVSNYGYLSR